MNNQTEEDRALDETPVADFVPKKRGRLSNKRIAKLEESISALFLAFYEEAEDLNDDCRVNNLAFEIKAQGRCNHAMEVKFAVSLDANYILSEDPHANNMCTAFDEALRRRGWKQQNDTILRIGQHLD